jgi:malonyl-CoA O-methyltransferase
MSDTPFHIDKQRMRAAFDRAAATYDRVALLQREVGARLYERLDYLRIEPRVTLDLGAGTGQFSAKLARRYRSTRVITLDIAPAMVSAARRSKRWFSKQRFVCGDAEALPLANQSVDLIFSNLTLQWCTDLDAVFRECTRILAPGGAVLFSTLGPDTLRELRSCWRSVDAYNHVNAFIDMHDVGDAMLRGGLTDPVVDADRLTLTYPDVFRLMSDLKLLGARNATAGRARGLTGKGKLQAMIAAYEQLRHDGALPATYEVVYGHAWGRDGAVKTPTRGTAAIPLAALQQRLRRPP